ncbi:hypothetical protein [Myxosarcina sp. GI1(2024)]
MNLLNLYSLPMPKLICLGDSITAREREYNGTLKLTPILKQVRILSKKIQSIVDEPF